MVDTSILYLSCKVGESQKVFGIYNSLGTVGLLVSAVIYSIYVTIKEPAVGDTPATTGTMREGASTYITGISWDGDFDENGCFKAGGCMSVQFQRVVFVISFHVAEVYIQRTASDI